MSQTLKRTQDNRILVAVNTDDGAATFKLTDYDAAELRDALTRLLPPSPQSRAWEAFIELSKSISNAQVMKITLSGLLTSQQLASLITVLKIASGKP